MKLQIQNLNAFYGAVQVLRDVGFTLTGGEVLCLFGRNGAGKSTALKAIMGLVRANGSIDLDGAELAELPAHLRRGLGYVPQGRRLFAELNVDENLQVGLMARGDSALSDAEILDSIFAMFPALASRRAQAAGTLSGGEQQMLAMARALCSQPKALLLDEPSEGLMPSMVGMIREVIVKLRTRGVGVLLVEQRVESVLSVADRAAFVENGRVVAVVDVLQLRESPQLMRKYAGVG